jgi:uncharacterized membrane protein
MIGHKVDTSPASPRAESRVEALDAARGAAMVLVCVSHFANAYLLPAGADRQANWMTAIAMIATPTFILVSGVLMGYLSAVYRAGPDAYRTKLIDRGLFLLIIGHLWLTMTAVLRSGGILSPLKHEFITDVIGVALVIMVPIVANTPSRLRLQAGLSLAVLAYMLSLGWHHTSGWSELIGWTDGPTFPLLPWLGVYAAGTALGTRVLPLLRAGREREAGRMLARMGIAAVALAVVLRVVLRTQMPTHNTLLTLLNMLTTPWEKVPPSPGYLLFFGGLGLLLAGSLLAAPPALHRWRVVRALTLLGRNSLCAYLVQNFVYFVLVYGLALPYHPAWPLLFVATVGIVFVVAWRWDVARGNRFLTVGYPSMRAAFRARFGSARMSGSPPRHASGSST